MKIYSVFDPEFKPYGQIVEGMAQESAQICQVLATTPLPQNVAYTAEEPRLQQLPAMEAVSQRLYGGMPVQLGWCNGHNSKLNCLEYHRDSEFNVGTEDFVLLLARQEEIRDGVLDTGKVKAFWVPAGVMIECYATTLHYMPLHVDGYLATICLLTRGTNADIDQPCGLVTAENKFIYTLAGQAGGTLEDAFSLK